MSWDTNINTNNTTYKSTLKESTSTKLNSQVTVPIGGANSPKKPADTVETSNKDILSAEDLQAATDDFFDGWGEKAEIRVDSNGMVHVKCIDGDITMKEIKKALQLADNVIDDNNSIENNNGNNAITNDNSWWFDNNPFLDKLSLNKGAEIVVPMDKVGGDRFKSFFTSDLVTQIKAAREKLQN